VTDVNAGSTRFVLFLMPKGMLKKKTQNISATVAVLKREKMVHAHLYCIILFLGERSAKDCA